MFGTKVEFLGLADRVDLLRFEPIRRGRRTSSWKISNDICGTSYLIHFFESSFAGILERLMREK